MRHEVDDWTYSECRRGGEEEVLAAVFVPKRRHEPVEIVPSLNSRSGCFEIDVFGIRSNVFRLVLLSNLGVPFPVLSTSLCIFSGFKSHKKKCW